jgi:anti-sigma factor RsiW
MTRCAQPIEFETLAAYWLGELAEATEAPLEEHLFGCAHCARRLESLAALASGIRAAVRDGALFLALTPRFLQHMKDQGLRIREYPAEPGESVNCTITAEDDAVVSRLRAPLAGAKRVDALHSLELGGGRIERRRVQDLPFDEESGEVLFTPSTKELRTLPAHTWRVQLLAVDESGERTLGEYAFAHTPG